MATRFRKSRRQRGSRYCGWGQIGQHRQSGSRGGVGQAGKHKHFWIRTIKEDSDHFGHDSLVSLNKSFVKKWINLRDIASLSKKYGVKEDDSYVINLTSLGYDKLLGSGNVAEKYTVTINGISKRAKEKIESIGGKVITNEQSSE